MIKSFLKRFVVIFLGLLCILLVVVSIFTLFSTAVSLAMSFTLINVAKVLLSIAFVAGALSALFVFLDNALNS